MNSTLERYLGWYRKLLRLYPAYFREQFGESMEQVFKDPLEDPRETAKGVVAFVCWVYLETSIEIVRKNLSIQRDNMGILRISVVTILILSLPLVAMQFTDEVNWGLFDFVVAGLLVFGAGLSYELMKKRFASSMYRVALGIAIGTALILVWVNLAVGIIGNESNPANYMYFGVLGVGFIGAIVYRFQPDGMARTMIVMSVAQILVTFVALNWETGFTLFANGILVVLWIVSALLFRQASTVLKAA